MFIILGVAVFTFLLALFMVILLFNKAEDTNPPFVTNITLCDLDDSGLCIVTFGANDLDRMVINFQLPQADYPIFYVKAINRGIINVYSCEVVKAVSTSAYCTGVRTPLGESIDIEVYSTDGDVLMARGAFVVSAILLPTPVGLINVPRINTAAPAPAPTEAVIATETEPASIFDDAYPNPSTETVRPNPSSENAYPNP